MQPASRFPDRALCEAMNDAFSDYALPLQLSEEDFRQMMRQRGLDRAHSLVAVEDGGIAAVWLVSVRQDRGYLISSGTRPAFRSRGIARRLGTESLATLKSAGVRSFQTEVLDGNDVAAALYFKLGMSVARHLDCYDVPALDDAALPSSPATAASWSELAGRTAALRSWKPSWQNSDRSLSAISDGVLCSQVSDDMGFAGYAVVIRESAALAQIAVRQDRRREGFGRTLVTHLRQQLPGRSLRVINAEADDASFAGFMSSLGAVRTAGQRELYTNL